MTDETPALDPEGQPIQQIEGEPDPTSGSSPSEPPASTGTEPSTESPITSPVVTVEGGVEVPVQVEQTKTEEELAHEAPQSPFLHDIYPGPQPLPEPGATKS